MLPAKPSGIFLNPASTHEGRADPRRRDEIAQELKQFLGLFDRRQGPKALKVIEAPGFILHDVDKHISQVHKHPVKVPSAFNAKGLPPAPSHGARRGQPETSHAGRRPETNTMKSVMLLASGNIKGQNILALTIV